MQTAASAQTSRLKTAGLILASVLILTFTLSSCRIFEANGKMKTESFEEKRKYMTELIADYPGGYPVTDAKVLAAMSKVPRHEFVPEYLQPQAYDDGPLPIGYGQTISQPYIVAYMTQMLQLRETDKILEIGTGSGYQAAVIAEIVTKGHVYTIDIVEPLVLNARKVLTELGYKNITVRYADGYKGWPEHAPFDAVIVTCAPDDVPQALVDQLKEGGHMAIPVGEKVGIFWGAQELFLLKKTKDGLKRERHFAVRFVPMVEEK
jgi:protein-L-isoaspartate(D-aspartate) O-methyltransferase